MRILVVDDDKDIREFLKRSLISEYFEVDLAKEGEEALSLIFSNDYDLIILDNQMPKKSGKSVCKEVREDGIPTPILILSVLSEPFTKADLINIGADDYLTKPFSLKELLARVRALLRRPKKIEDEIIKLDNLEVNIQKQLVKRNNEKIYLTLKEFMILEYLVKNKGNVITRGMILDHVWDMNANPFSNTVDAHIYNLRKKIDLKGQKKLIYTVPGRGYKIDLEK